MAFILPKTIINFKFCGLVIPLIAFNDNPIKVSKKGKIMGKLSMAIIVGLFPVFDAIADTIERMIPKPVEPKKTVSRKRLKFTIGFPKKVI